jgi:hypothetical protein
MNCRACHLPALGRKSSHGMCLGHALLYLLGPCTTVEQFILMRPSHAPRNHVECPREEAP